MKPIVAAIASAFAFSSCAFFTNDTVVSGAVWPVSKDDIRAAIAAARVGEKDLKTAPIYEVTVASRYEIRVYIGHTNSTGSQYAEVRKINGKWRYITSWRTVVTS